MSAPQIDCETSPIELEGEINGQREGLKGALVMTDGGTSLMNGGCESSICRLQLSLLMIVMHPITLRQ